MRLLKFLVIAIAVICGGTVSAQSVKKVHMVTELKADTTLVFEYPKGENIISAVAQFTAADQKAETKEEHVYLWETQTASLAVVVRDVPGRWMYVAADKPLYEVYFLSQEGKKIQIAFEEKK